MYKYFKRGIDIILSSIGIVVTSPILLIAGLAVKIEDPKSPIFFIQRRVGYKEKIFGIYKLRTMKVNEKTGVNEVTKVGKFLRSTSIDELPQLLNILKGEMSFLGPRPWIEDYSKYFNDEERRRNDVLPGLSGLAQVRGRNGITIQQKLDADIEYVDNFSFKMDMYILLKTVEIVLKRTNASIKEATIQEELQYLKEKQQKELKEKETKKSKKEDKKEIKNKKQKSKKK